MKTILLAALVAAASPLLANAQTTTMEVPQGSWVFPTLGQVNCLEEMGSGRLCAATWECADGESGELWGDMVNHDGRRVIDADSPVAAKRSCSIEVSGKASVRWLSGYRPDGRTGEVIGLTSFGEAMRPVHRVLRSATTVNGSVLDYVLERHDITLVQFIDDECGHIQEGHEDRTRCEGEHLRQVVMRIMYVGLTPFTRCVVELAEMHIRHYHPNVDVGLELLFPQGRYASLRLLVEPHEILDGRHEYQRAGAEAKFNQCWDLHLEQIGSHGLCDVPEHRYLRGPVVCN